MGQDLGGVGTGSGVNIIKYSVYMYEILKEDI